MKRLQAIVLTCLCAASLNCGSAGTAVERANGNVSATPVPTASIPKNDDYPARGKVTKINEKDGSIELDHEEIKGVMPAMKMEFFVIDSAILKGINVGDDVSFVMRYKDGQEIVTEITKQK